MMTTLDVDTAFHAVVAAEATLEDIPFFLGTSPELLPQTALGIVATGALNKVAGDFFLAEVSFLIDSPALEDNLAAHAALCSGLTALLADGAGLISLFDSAFCSLIGTNLVRTEARTQDDRWIFEGVLSIGLVAI